MTNAVQLEPSDVLINRENKPNILDFTERLVRNNRLQEIYDGRRKYPLIDQYIRSAGLENQPKDLLGFRVKELEKNKLIEINIKNEFYHLVNYCLSHGYHSNLLNGIYPNPLVILQRDFSDILSLALKNNLLYLADYLIIFYYNQKKRHPQKPSTLNMEHIKRQNSLCVHQAVEKNLHYLMDCFILFRYPLGNCDINGQTPLFKAIKTKNEHAFIRLVANCQNLDIQDHVGNTPLHCAVAHGNIDFVTLLIQRGAKKDIKNYHNQTALDLALQIIKNSHTASSQYMDIITLLQSLKDGWTEDYSDSSSGEEVLSDEECMPV